MAEHFNLLQAGRMQHEATLHSDGMADAPHRNPLAQAASAALQHHALKGLQTFPSAFDNLHVYLNRVARAEIRQLFYLFLLDRFYHIHLLFSCSGPAKADWAYEV